MELRVMTFNIQHGLRYPQQDAIDLKRMADAIRQCGADIVGLNEVRGDGGTEEYQAQAQIIAGYLGFYYYFAPALIMQDGGPYGNALLSRYPIVSAEKIMIEDPLVKDEDTYYETRCVIHGQVDVAGGLDVFVSHFGLAKAEQRNAVKTVTRLVKNASRPCVFMGDLNMVPSDPILDPLYDLLTDTAARDGSQMTWIADKPDRKLDYIFVKGDIAVKHFEVPELIASDHRPCIADLSI